MTNGRSGAWDDRVTHEVESGIIVAVSYGCCWTEGMVESGSGRASSCKRDGSKMAKSGDAVKEVADMFASSSMSVLFSVLFSFFIIWQRHFSRSVLL